MHQTSGIPFQFRFSSVMSSTGINEAADTTGFIRYEVNVSDITETGVRSPVVEVLELPWHLLVKKNELDSSSFLQVYIYHHKSDSDIWSIDISAKISIIKIDGANNQLCQEFKKTLNRDNTNWGLSELVKWDDLINEAKGFIKDGKIIIECRFTLSKVVGFRTIRRIDFTDKDEPRHDVALVIEGENVYASKQILAVHSPVFNAMFYGDFAEKDKNEIELKEINRKEFIEMLNFIYPSNAKITDANAEFLLKLGDRFQIKTILDQCEQFLINSDKWNILRKLDLSDQFRLVKLQDNCLDSLITVKDITNLKTVDGYKELSRNIKATLLDKNSFSSVMSSTGSDEAADATGLIHFEISVSDITKSGIRSPVVEVLELPWHLLVKKNELDSASFLGVFLYHGKSDSDIWSIDVSNDISLMNTEKEKNIRNTIKQTFNHEHINWGTSQFIKWDELINEEKGFIKDGKITIEARFTISKVVGFRTIPRINFTNPDEPRHDVTLVIEGEKVYASKQILAVHSPVFNAMFYGDFVEKDMKEIELKDIDRKDFIDMLYLMYPSYKKVTDANAESLLKVGDRFQIKTVIDQCEQILINSNKWNIPRKLDLSEQFRLVKLQDNCLDSFKTVKDITNLKTVDGYKELSKNMKGTLLEKAMKLS